MVATTPIKRPAIEPTRGFVRIVLLIVAIGLLAYCAWIWTQTRSNPAVAFLTRSGPGEWIRHDDAVSLESHGAGKVARGFRVRFAVSVPPTDAVLRVKAMKRINVLIDGKAIAKTASDAARWKIEHAVQLASHVTPGDHELTILVENENGPAVVWAVCENLNIRTNASWESSADGRNWQRARLASERPAAEIARQFDTPIDALGRRWLIFGLVFVTGVAATLFFHDRKSPLPRFVQPAAIRWIVLAAWAIMAGNNILKLPGAAGFDANGHMAYISFLLTNHRLPLAPDGWQMFQSPLNYLISAPLFVGLYELVGPATAVLLLRVLPLACGLLQIELCYRATRRVFPQRPDLQILGTVFAGFLPMNIYLSHYVGNEPLAGMLSAAVFVVSLKLVTPGAADRGRWTEVWLGTLFGLALLAKVSAVLMGVPLLLAIIHASVAGNSSVTERITRFARTSTVVFGIAALIGGWYYVRNWIHLGRPFIGGWDLNRGITWWQDPGYRTASEFLTFGSALIRPICAGLESFWDGFYATFWCDSYLSSAMTIPAAPAWNYGYMMAGVLLALVPTAALAIGIIAAIRDAVGRVQPVWVIALACLGVYVVAAFHFALTVPYYSTVKAFYAIGAMPAFALIAVAGFELLTRHKWCRPIVHGLIGCWAISVYVAYFAHR